MSTTMRNDEHLESMALSPVGDRHSRTIPRGFKARKPKLPKLEVKVEEKMLKVKVVEEHVGKMQDLQICDKHVSEISILVLETTKEVGVLKTFNDEVAGFKTRENVKRFDCELKIGSEQDL
ncbi:hypothetical protein Tco_0404411 [Tanacetum coccineum]